MQDFYTNELGLIRLYPGANVDFSAQVTFGPDAEVEYVIDGPASSTNNFGYIQHLMGPAWYLAPIISPIEVISLCVRPITLAVRLMLNMAVDHLLLSIFLGFLAVLVPLPVMILGVIVVLVQTLVFTLLTTIYISLATEHDH